MMTKQTQAEAEAANKAAVAAFAAKRKPAATAKHPFAGNVGDLAEKSAAIKAARALVSGSIKVFGDGKLIAQTPLDADADAGAVVNATLAKAKEDAFKVNMAGKVRHTGTVRIEIEAVFK